MGQLSNTTGLLLSKNKQWTSRWYMDTNYSKYFHEDLSIKKYIVSILIANSIHYSKCIIQRSKEYIVVYLNIYSEERGHTNLQSTVTQIKEGIDAFTKSNIVLHIKTVKKLDAQIISSLIKEKISSRQTFQLIFTQILNKVKKDIRIKGIRIQCSGRPNGSDMSTVQWSKYGPIPVHSYNKNIDFTFTEVHTKYGLCGVKVWVYYI